MKRIRQRTVQLLSYTYAIGIFVSLFTGALSFLGYLTAIIIGGYYAEMICKFIYRDIYPVIFYISSGSVIIGLIKTYLAGEKTMAFSKGKK